MPSQQEEAFNALTRLLETAKTCRLKHRAIESLKSRSVGQTTPPGRVDHDAASSVQSNGEAEKKRKMTKTKEKGAGEADGEERLDTTLGGRSGGQGEAVTSHPPGEEKTLSEKKEDQLVIKDEEILPGSTTTPGLDGPPHHANPRDGEEAVQKLRSNFDFVQAVDQLGKFNRCLVSSQGSRRATQAARLLCVSAFVPTRVKLHLYT